MLFTDRIRHDPSHAAAEESTFGFLDRVATPFWSQVRELLEDWFQRYPALESEILRESFRSDERAKHVAAWWELYLHELYLRLGYEIEVHPPLPDSKRTPDFLLTRRGSRLYVEASVVFSGINGGEHDDGAPGWLQDAIDTIVDPRFFVSIADITPGPERLKKREVTVPLERWLAGLDPDQAEADHKAGWGLPQTTCCHRGWEITYEAWPVMPSARDRSDHKVLGGGPVQAGWVNDVEQLQSKLKAKAGRYGRPDIPLVTAIYCASTFMTDLDIEQALFGREAVLIPPGPSIEPKTIRQRNGFWTRGDGPQNRRVSAVLTAVELTPWTVCSQAPKLWLNPWADHPLAEEWPFSVATATDQGAVSRDPQEPSMANLFQLPPQWPAGIPFPSSE